MPLPGPTHIPPIGEQTDPDKVRVAAIVGGQLASAPARGFGLTTGELTAIEGIATGQLADMGIGFRTSGNRFVVNDKANLTGTDVMTVSETGAVTAAAFTTTQTYASNTAAVILTPSGAGTVYLRPNGGSSTGQMNVNANGDMAVTGNISPGGNVYAGGNGTFQGGYSTTGTNAGVSIFTGFIRTSATAATASGHMAFYNTNGNVGQITTTNSATAYATSSDENLKDFIGLYDPLSAIEIIRADPVRDFRWKVDGTYAVGWGAQTSYNVSQDLAVPPPLRSPEEVAVEGPGTDPKEPGYNPWGMDQSKRTPYLWAALAHALDRIDQLEARIAALEAA